MGMEGPVPKLCCGAVAGMFAQTLTYVVNGDGEEGVGEERGGGERREEGKTYMCGHLMPCCVCVRGNCVFVYECVKPFYVLYVEEMRRIRDEWTC
jgi:hypothetical protein